MIKNKEKSLGQITVGVGVGISLLALIAGGVSGFFNSNIVINDKISADRERISSLEANDKNLNAWLTRIENKLDRVIENK